MADEAAHRRRTQDGDAARGFSGSLADVRLLEDF